MHGKSVSRHFKAILSPDTMGSSLRIFALCVPLLLACASASEAQSRDPDEPTAVFVRAWNAHDMKSFGEMLSDDADWVTVAGSRLRGRTAILGFLSKEHNGWAKGTSMSTNSVAVRALGTDAAAVHFNWEITGVKGRDGKPAAAARGTTLFVVLKQGTDWGVVAGQVALQKTTP